ncbi:hypothetical protein ACGFZR_15350 [Streptomyces sp. NPDC048241]|uniref:hypothetical protein n=1 Tax=Streptomyces sp. NPDC048241 TaxID=3365521 RepID=UPI0037103378
MNTTAAALEAKVTVATIRTWCRRGVVAAIKQAGRWVIDTASLTTRITVGMRRKRMQQIPGTMSSKGEHYVAVWPAGVANRLDISPEYVAEAMTRTGLATTDEAGTLRSAFLRKTPTAQIAKLTPADAQRVLAELKAIARDLNATRLANCHYCGQSLNRRSGECDECGAQ